ncbi:MAG: hypothetical protein AB8F78_00375 [Saprospiraceae bacterium]
MGLSEQISPFHGFASCSRNDLAKGDATSTSWKSPYPACNVLPVHPTVLHMCQSYSLRAIRRLSNESLRLIAVCICALFICGALDVQAQTDQAWPVRVAVYDESLTLPGASTFSYPFNPAFGIGTTYDLFSKKRAAKEEMPKGKWFLLGEFGGYHHQYVRSALQLSSAIGYRHQFGQLGLALDFGPGLTYAFTPEKTYRFDNGTYGEVTDWGAAGLHVATSFGVSWKFNNEANAPEVSLIARQSFEDPFRNIPFPHFYLGAGFTFYPFAR